MIVRARVRKGRLVLDEPTDLPDGAEVALEIVDDVLDEELGDQRAALEASIARARAEGERGEGIRTTGSARASPLTQTAGRSPPRR